MTKDTIETSFKDAQDSFIESKIKDFETKLFVLDDIMAEIREICGSNFRVETGEYAIHQNDMLQDFITENTAIRMKKLAGRYRQLTSIRQMIFNTREVMKKELTVREVTKRLTRKSGNGHRKPPRKNPPVF